MPVRCPAAPSDPPYLRWNSATALTRRPVAWPSAMPLEQVARPSFPWCAAPPHLRIDIVDVKDRLSAVQLPVAGRVGNRPPDRRPRGRISFPITDDQAAARLAILAMVALEHPVVSWICDQLDLAFSIAMIPALRLESSGRPL